MKKILVVLCALICIVMVGCSKAPKKNNTTIITVTPHTTDTPTPTEKPSYKSAEDISAVLGFTVPTLPTECTDVQYDIDAGNVACVSFVYEGITYDIRCAKSDKDFSKIAISVMYEDVQDDYTYTLCGDEDLQCSKVFWKKDDVSYYLLNYNTTTAEKILALYEEIR